MLCIFLCLAIAGSVLFFVIEGVSKEVENVPERGWVCVVINGRIRMIVFS